jgi:hypothetical protein
MPYREKAVTQNGNCIKTKKQPHFKPFKNGEFFFLWLHLLNNKETAVAMAPLT